jgi:nitronate monooxygenase
MNFGERRGDSGPGGPRAWKDIWGCGQGIGVIDAVVDAAELVSRLAAEYAEARTALCGPGTNTDWMRPSA